MFPAEAIEDARLKDPAHVATTTAASWQVLHGALFQGFLNHLIGGCGILEQIACQGSQPGLLVQEGLQLGGIGKQTHWIKGRRSRQKHLGIFRILRPDRRSVCLRALATLSTTPVGRQGEEGCRGHAARALPAQGVASVTVGSPR